MFCRLLVCCRGLGKYFVINCCSRWFCIWMFWVEGVFWFSSLFKKLGGCLWILYLESVVRWIDFIWLVREFDSWGNNKVLVEFVRRKWFVVCCLFIVCFMEMNSLGRCWILLSVICFGGRLWMNLMGLVCVILNWVWLFRVMYF